MDCPGDHQFPNSPSFINYYILYPKISIVSRKYFSINPTLRRENETCFKKTFFALVSHEAVVFVQNVGICSALFTRSLSNFLFYLQLGKTLLSFFMSLKTLFIYTIQGSLSSSFPNVPIVFPTYDSHTRYQVCRKRHLHKY